MSLDADGSPRAKQASVLPCQARWDGQNPPGCLRLGWPPFCLAAQRNDARFGEGRLKTSGGFQRTGREGPRGRSPQSGGGALRAGRRSVLAPSAKEKASSKPSRPLERPEAGREKSRRERGDGSGPESAPWGVLGKSGQGQCRVAGLAEVSGGGGENRKLGSAFEGGGSPAGPSALFSRRPFHVWGATPEGRNPPGTHPLPPQDHWAGPAPAGACLLLPPGPRASPPRVGPQPTSPSRPGRASGRPAEPQDGGKTKPNCGAPSGLNPGGEARNRELPPGRNGAGISSGTCAGGELHSRPLCLARPRRATRDEGPSKGTQDSSGPPRPGGHLALRVWRARRASRRGSRPRGRRTRAGDIPGEAPQRAPGGAMAKEGLLPPGPWGCPPEWSPAAPERPARLPTPKRPSPRPRASEPPAGWERRGEGSLGGSRGRACRESSLIQFPGGGARAWRGGTGPGGRSASSSLGSGGRGAPGLLRQSSSEGRWPGGPGQRQAGKLHNSSPHTQRLHWRPLRLELQPSQSPSLPFSALPTPARRWPDLPRSE